MSRSDFLFMAVFDIIFAIVTVPTEHRAAEKWAALKRLKLSMCRPLSTETLDLLEELEDIGFRLGKETSKKMKDAYLNVAVHITRDILTNHGEAMDTLGKISKIYGVWVERMNKEAAKNDNRLGSKELLEWYEKIKVGKSLMSNDDDDLLRATVESLFRGLVDVQTSLVGYIVQEICEIISEVSFIVDGDSTSSAQKKGRRCISPEPSELPPQSSPELFDASPRIERLTRALESKEIEVLHWKGHAGHVQTEADVKLTAAQEKFDELKARLLELEEKLEFAQDKAKAISEEHAEYEAIIKKQYGEDSLEYREWVDEPKKLVSTYETVKARHRKLMRRLFPEADPSSSANPGLRSRVLDRYSREFLDGGPSSSANPSHSSRILEVPMTSERGRGQRAPPERGRSQRAVGRESPNHERFHHDAGEGPGPRSV